MIKDKKDNKIEESKSSHAVAGPQKTKLKQ